MEREHELEIELAAVGAAAVAVLVPFAAVALMVETNVGWLHSIDQSVTDGLNRFALAHGGWVTFMKGWSLVFDPNSWRVAAAGLALWLAFRRNARPLAWWVVATMTAGGVLNAVLKLVFQRHRPALLDAVAHAAGYSFPSGHALNNALGAAVFLLVLLPLTRGRRWERVALWTGAILIPAVTGVSRVMLGVHWTSDVVGGWLLGAAVPAVTAWTYLHWRRRLSRKTKTHVTTEGLEPEIAG